jgi:2'-hydroxyisoflavone reductase
MKLLVLGGTVFLGRAVVEAALAAGHEVTMFNRGQRNPGLFPDVEKLRGDRGVDLSALKGRHWDLAIDTSGYVPRVVRASAELLADQVEHYSFISTISVYPDMATPGLDESAPVGKLQDETVEEITGDTYGPLKALCEQAADAAMPGRVLTVRPGLIVGPHDVSDRFPYWPRRVAQGGEVLAPARPDFPVQIIDVRDLASFTLRMAEARRTGIYNATGPDYGLTMAQALTTCREVSGSDATFTWVPEEFLLQQQVTPWMEMPLWVPEASSGLGQVNVSKAVAAGLTFRPLAETARATLAWDRTREPVAERRAGMKPEKEQAILMAWHEQHIG